MAYTDDTMLMLSGVQHFVFCPRQWALIYIDGVWSDNALTTEGHILHKRVDNPNIRQKNNGFITLRSVHIASATLGLYGIADAIELLPAPPGATKLSHPRFPGSFIPYPVEYKRGHKKPDLSDTMQLVCQAICLEEMYDVTIGKAALFYWETRHREEVEITDDLRHTAHNIAAEMHRMFDSGKLPAAQYLPKCKRCSLIDQCMPQLAVSSDVYYYLKENLYEKTS